MGWCVEHGPSRHRTKKEFHRAMFDERSEILATSWASGAVAAVVRTDLGDGTSTCWVSVTLINGSSEHGFGEKSMDESMGPYVVGFSAKFMQVVQRFVPDPPNEWAAKWRAKNWKMIEQKQTARR